MSALELMWIKIVDHCCVLSKGAVSDGRIWEALERFIRCREVEKFAERRFEGLGDHVVREDPGS